MRGFCALLGFALVAVLPSLALAQQTPSATVIQIKMGDHAEAWALTVEAEGEPVDQRGKDAIAALFHFYDVDHDQRLDDREAQDIASPAGLRQLPLGRLLPTTIERPAHMDQNADGHVTLAEFQTFYAASRQAGLWLTCDTTPRNAELNAALLRAMEIEPGTYVDQQQVESGMTRLGKLDTNADQLISPGEILTGHVYPGITPTRMVSGNTSSIHSFGNLSVSQADATMVDHHWSVNLQPGGAQLRDRKQAADDEKSGQPTTLTSHSAATSARLHVAPANHTRAQAAMTDLASQFASSAGQDHQLKLSEVAGMQNQVDLEQLIPLADANQDGVLTADEFARWQAVAEAYIRTVVVVTVLDFEQNLFTALDTNFDGSLSMQERTSAWHTLSAGGVLTPKGFLPQKLPRQLRMVVSQGPCQQLLDQGSAQGPAWFQAMDRNRDGRISRDEFPASSEKFSGLDQDGDGFLALKEVGADAQNDR